MLLHRCKIGSNSDGDVVSSEYMSLHYKRQRGSPIRSSTQCSGRSRLFSPVPSSTQSFFRPSYGRSEVRGRMCLGHLTQRLSDDSHVGQARWYEARSFHQPLPTIPQVLESQLVLSLLYCGGGLDLVPGSVPLNTIRIERLRGATIFRTRCNNRFLFYDHTEQDSISCVIGVDSTRTESYNDPTLPARRTLSPSFIDTSKITWRTSYD